MNRWTMSVGTVLLAIGTVLFADPTYLKRFQAYQQWRENTPVQPDEQFLKFIAENKPLSKKLRNQWLFKLAEEKQWQFFLNYYQPDSSTSLQCYQAWAYYQTNQSDKAAELAKPLWLVGRSQNQACDLLFAALLKDGAFNNDLIEQRIKLALRIRNLPLSRYLLGKLTPPRLDDQATLVQIYRQPTHINHLSTAPLHDEFYLYGLKRMVSRNMDQAIKYWRHVKSKKLLNPQQQQAFLAHVALYKAIRNHNDAYYWFKKVNPEHYNNALLEWQIRYALKNRKWQRVLTLIALMPDQNDPGLLYWRARAEEKTGRKKQALEHYQQLADMRHYYGFLANTRLKKPLQFAEENPTENKELLKSYQPVLDEIQDHYKSKHYLTASRMINDFASELPKNEQSALALWVANELQWFGKSVYLSNDETLHNQLDLRFPLAHSKIIRTELKGKSLPKAFVFAIIRQESAFRAQVVSAVGARGLMQLMPKTASMVARNNQIPYQNAGELFEADKNISLGVAYLNQLHKRFNGHPALMAAAYNAGPHQVDRWLKNDTPEEIDIWVETIPFHETRNYLKNIMAFYAVYQYRLQQPAKLGYFLQPVKK